jgi:hypothetical protein
MGNIMTMKNMIRGLCQIHNFGVLNVYYLPEIFIEIAWNRIKLRTISSTMKLFNFGP